MPGTFIAGMGLPGAGKSSIFAALADLLLRDNVPTTLYREPEETEWPDAVKLRDKCGRIGALTWFRAQRVPNLYKAVDDKAAGRVALVDSYYDKIVHLYFEDPGFAWLMTQDDPYRRSYLAFIALDHQLLPDADCVVSIMVRAERWRELVLGRGRELDRSADVLDTYSTQESFLKACDQYCKRRGIPHLRFENDQPSTLTAAIALREMLKTVGLLE